MITNGFVQWYNPYSVIAPPGALPAQQALARLLFAAFSYYGASPGPIHGGPGFGEVDLSVFKNFPIRERVKGQFRGEMYNVFNRVNYGKVTLASGNTAAGQALWRLERNSASSTGQITTTIGGTSAPGIAVGEPFNVQLAFKIIF